MQTSRTPDLRFILEITCILKRSIHWTWHKYM